MTHCVNISHPVVVDFAKRFGLHPAIVAAKIGAWQTEFNSEGFPSEEELFGWEEVRKINPDFYQNQQKQVSNQEVIDAINSCKI